MIIQLIISYHALQTIKDDKTLTHVHIEYTKFMFFLLFIVSIYIYTYIYMGAHCTFLDAGPYIIYTYTHIFFVPIQLLIDPRTTYLPHRHITRPIEGGRLYSFHHCVSSGGVTYIWMGWDGIFPVKMTKDESIVILYLLYRVIMGT